MEQETISNPLLEAALHYAERDWMVLPLQPKGKAPLGHLVPRGLHNATTDLDQIKRWWEQKPDANVGIRTGKVSELVVLDIDDHHEGEDSLVELEGRYEKLPDTVEALTGRGRHLYFRYPESATRIKCAVTVSGFRGLDIRGDEGYVVAPPSRHPNGHDYCWEVSSHPDDVPIAPLPHFLQQVVNYTNTPTSSEPAQPQISEESFVEGKRNNSLTTLAGTMRRRGMDEESILAALKFENQKRCQPPLSDEEVSRIAKSVARYKPTAPPSSHSNKTHSSKNGRPTSDSQASRLIQLVEAHNLVLFHDQFRTGFVQIPMENSHEIYRIRSGPFRNWLAYQMWEAEGNSPSSDTIQRTFNVLEAKAIHEGEQITLWNRVAKLDGAIWYDLGHDAVRITPGDWEVVQDPPILFYRFAHQRTQQLPEQSGSNFALLRSLNLFPIDGPLNSTSLLFVVYLVTVLIPDIPHPILAVQGEQGSGKTTLFKVIRELLDPSATPTLGPQDNLREFVQLASHHWLVWLDNLTKLPDWLGDAMCRCVTGEGFSKRELFSDDEDKLYSYRRCLGFNGINLISNKPDLLDRALIFSLERIPDAARQTEEAFWEQFHLQRPKYLGALFTLLSQAMTHLDSVTASQYPRMADFARWGEAITLALNLPPQMFRDALQENIRTQTRETLDASPMAQALLKFTETTLTWEGSPKELLDQLNAIAEDIGVDTKSRLWPKDVRWVWRRLKEIRPNLQTYGIRVSHIRMGDHARIRIVRENDPDVPMIPIEAS